MNNNTIEDVTDSQKDWEDFWNGPEANKGEGSKLP